MEPCPRHARLATVSNEHFGKTDYISFGYHLCGPPKTNFFLPSFFRSFFGLEGNFNNIPICEHNDGPFAAFLFGYRRTGICPFGCQK